MMEHESLSWQEIADRIVMGERVVMGGPPLVDEPGRVGIGVLAEVALLAYVFTAGRWAVRREAARGERVAPELKRVRLEPGR